MDFYQNITVEEGATYTISFDYKASHPKLRIWSFGIGDANLSVYNTTDATTDPMRTYYNGYFAKLNKPVTIVSFVDTKLSMDMLDVNFMTILALSWIILLVKIW